MEKVQVYARKSSNMYGLTDKQLEEAFTLYDLLVKSKITSKIQEEYPMLDFDEDDSLLELIHRVIDLATVEGADMVSDHRVINNYREYLKEQGQTTYSVTDHEFVEGKGVCGALFPDGKFVKCGNAEHYIIMENVDFEIQKKCVYFSSLHDGKDGVATFSPFGDKLLTDDQSKWISTNIIYMDSNQISMLEGYLS
ncbi:hypothetical protein [Paenibacillus amylolyticus]|uniref:hypothetical protein n=1 Tax=Paenibacillus amylolyticus TaxID=1451 RepID=UPI003393F847